MKRLLLYSSFLLLTQCSKCKDNDPRPEEQLPAATQTGANTFGCLVNGQPFTPKGRVGLLSNLTFEYDGTFSGGTFSVQAYRVGDGRQRYITLSAVPVPSTGAYAFTSPNGVAIIDYFDDELPDPCDEVDTAQPNYYSRGTLIITRLDDVAGIVSGTFEVTFARPGCDTIRLTQGRFDLKR